MLPSERADFSLAATGATVASVAAGAGAGAGEAAVLADLRRAVSPSRGDFILAATGATVLAMMSWFRQEL